MQGLDLQYNMSLRNSSQRLSHLSTLITCIDLTERGQFPAEKVQQTGNTAAAAAAEDHGPSRLRQTNKQRNLPSAVLDEVSVYQQYARSLLSGEYTIIIKCHITFSS